MQKTVKLVDAAYDYMKSVAEIASFSSIGSITVFFTEATKPATAAAVARLPNHRWLGGTLTNWDTIQKRISRLKQINAMEEDGTFEVLQGSA
ncbi:hypothetical protein EfmAA610_18080 [Enterococcus faecium]|nr:hypothetical protein EfmAA610_18080 [Enterococcus faecium]